MTRAREPWPEGVSQEDRASITAIYDASLGDNHSRRKVMSDWHDGYTKGSETNDKRWFCLQLAAQLCLPAEAEKIIEVAEKFAAFVTNHSPAAAAQSD